MILGSLPVTGMADAQQKKDKGRQQMFRDFARQNIQALLGVLTERMHLTDAGFRIDE